MRDVLRRSLGRSLGTMPALDRLAAAWPVACGQALARRGEILAYQDGVLRVQVEDQAWMDEMRRMSAVLERELARIAQVKLTKIHFELKK